MGYLLFKLCLEPSKPVIKHAIEGDLFKVSWPAILRAKSYWLQLKQENRTESNPNAWELNKETSREFAIGTDVNWGETVTVEVVVYTEDELTNKNDEKIFIG